MSAIIEAENISFNYQNQNILKGLTFNVCAGEFLAIAGPNGAGKTTLLNLLCGLLKADTGKITIDSADINSYSSKSLAHKIAVVRQEFVPVFDFTVSEIVSMARTPYLSASGFESKQDLQAVAEAMEITDTAGFADRPLRNLSGGERQRVFIARAFAQQTPILLLDEPTSFLDFKHQVDIYDLLKNAQCQKNKTIISVTHDINLAIQYCEKTLLLGLNEQYYLDHTNKVLTQYKIQNVFNVKVFDGNIGGEKFFFPLGRFAKAAKNVNGLSRENTADNITS
ncbi:MAG: ABC transporter ATP-binding protein [Sedimentisphaerales bacterium]|nr:ABC transporter ATP-binding protein [Sedimentisphaerales bacterium]